MSTATGDVPPKADIGPECLVILPAFHQISSDTAPLPAIGRDGDGQYFLIGAFRDERVPIQRPSQAVTTLGYSVNNARVSGDRLGKGRARVHYSRGSAL